MGNKPAMICPNQVTCPPRQLQGRRENVRLATRNKGFTIVESMLAIVFMLLAVLAGGAFLYHSSIRINIERNKRTALEAANGRLEAMRAALYDDIAGVVGGILDDGGEHNIRWDKAESKWKFDGADDAEKVDINGKMMTITTKVQYVDLNGSPPPPDYDYLKATVTVYYRSTAESVTLTTYISPR